MLLTSAFLKGRFLKPETSDGRVAYSNERLLIRVKLGAEKRLSYVSAAMWCPKRPCPEHLP
jgi:hypothetical protein